MITRFAVPFLILAVLFLPLPFVLSLLLFAVLLAVRPRGEPALAGSADRPSGRASPSQKPAPLTSSFSASAPRTPNTREEDPHEQASDGLQQIPRPSGRGRPVRLPEDRAPDPGIPRERRARPDDRRGDRAPLRRRLRNGGSTRTGGLRPGLEAARRATGLEAHDVQLIAALAMADGKIAELPTGEGKTLAAVFTASSLALAGRPVHVLTFNDYLARRDAAWMGPVYRLLGLSVGAAQEGHGQAGRSGRPMPCDVDLRHGQGGRLRLPARPAGLRARRAGPPALRCGPRRRGRLHPHRRGAHPARHLRDGRRERRRRRRAWPPSCASLERGRDYETDAENANVFPTDAGIRRIEAALGSGNLFAPENETLLAAVHCALHAQLLLERDVDYIVRDGRIEIVDEFTGRVMDKRHWPDGLQAAVEAKEGVRRGSEGRILGSITLQHFFRLYPTLCGMTATAAPSARELKEFYGLGVVVVPPHRPCVRARPPRRRLHPQGRQARGAGPGDRRRPRRRPARPRRHGERQGIGGARRGPRPGRRRLRGPQRQERRARSGASSPGPAPRAR